VPFQQGIVGSNRRRGRIGSTHIALQRQGRWEGNVHEDGLLTPHNTNGLLTTKLLVTPEAVRARTHRRALPAPVTGVRGDARGHANNFASTGYLSPAIKLVPL
jgi:hypothetical protein